MSLAAALIPSLQGAAPASAPPPANASASAARTVALPVEARAEILRPLSVRLLDDGSIELTAHPNTAPPQRERDANGTIWIHFS